MHKIQLKCSILPVAASIDKQDFVSQVFFGARQQSQSYVSLTTLNLCLASLDVLHFPQLGLLLFLKILISLENAFTWECFSRLILAEWTSWLLVLHSEFSLFLWRVTWEFLKHFANCSRRARSQSEKNKTHLGILLLQHFCSDDHHHQETFATGRCY